MLLFGLLIHDNGACRGYLSLECLSGGLKLVVVEGHVRPLIIVPLHEQVDGLAGPHEYGPKLGKLALDLAVYALQLAVGLGVLDARQYLPYAQLHQPLLKLRFPLFLASASLA